MEFSNKMLQDDEGEMQLRMLIDMIPELIVLKDGDGRWLVCNKMVMDIHNLSETDYINKTDLELAEIRPALRSLFEYNAMTDEKAWKNGSTLMVEKSFADAEGIHHIWEVSKTPIYKENGERHRLIIVSRDVTERRQAEQELQAHQARYQLIADNMTDIVTMVTPELEIRYMSPSLKHVLGYDFEGFMTDHRFTVVHPDDLLEFTTAFENAVEQRLTNHKMECRYLHASGKYIWFELNISYVSQPQDGAEDYVLIISHNVTERKEHAQQLNSLAYMDPLTGVPNRRYLMHQLEQEIETAKQNCTLLGLLYLDVDRFKAVNDTFGHETGDELLMQMVERISSELGPLDTIARLGGDEFVIVLSMVTSTSQISWMADAICNILQQPWDLNGQEVVTGSSVGVAVYPDDGLEAGELLRNADHALYQAKNMGRMQVCFYQEQEY